MKKKFKSFFTLKGKAKDGFTLVELIVVIAILAILAGVAVPVYSGYVKKADRAADEQLLAIINKAFSAACIESGVNIVTLNSSTADIPLNEDGSLDIDNMLPATCKEAFEAFFAGNEGAKFKAFEDIYYSSALLGFSENATLEYSYGDGTVYLNSEAVEALIGSTFLNASTLNGSSGLLDQVNTVTEIAAGMAGSLNAVFTDETFKQSAMNVLGVTTDAEYQAKQQELVAELMEKNGYTMEQATAQLAANSAVLYAAESATNFTDAQINELFSSVGIETVKNNLKGADTTTGMAQAALIYGMYTAYAHDSGNETLINNTNNALAVLDALENDDDFIAFVNSDQGKEDMDAYLGSLGMITDTAASSPSAVEHLMINGFNNEELKDLIAEATGK